MGAPTTYNDYQADLICALLAEGKSLREICSLEGFPAKSTVYQWLAIPGHPFMDKYTRARDLQADAMFEKIQDVAFDESRDVTGELGMPNSVAVQRDKLKVDSLKWMLSKMLPKKYGDRIETEHTGTLGLQLVHSVPQPERLED
jgi:hypothetical protein